MSVNGETEDFEDFESEGIPEGSMENVNSENQKLKIELEKVSAELNAQKRELEIETALEKVRATAMSMHKSEGLRTVVQILYDQLRNLGFQWGAASITIMDPETGDIDWWMEGFGDGYVLPECYHVTFFDHPGHIQQLEHWKIGTPYAEVKISGQDKKEYDAYYFFKTDFVHAPEASKQLMMQQETVRFSMAYMKYGALSWSPTPLSQDQTKVLERFAKVFEQCYTRFLDLQKAEAQAREAQIETALEKIRSRSLAMHHSDELREVIGVTYQMLSEIKVKHDTIAIQVFDFENKSSVFWPGNNLKEVAPKVILPYDEAIMEEDTCHRDLWNAMATGESIINKVYTKKQKDRWFEYVFAHNDSTVIDEHDRQYILQGEIHTVCFFPEKNSGVFADSWDGSQYSQEDLEVLKRVGRAFEQAYVRFLDLQKAEAQAREAQIEVALERVRAKAMAMHESRDLNDVVHELRKQMGLLGQKDLDTCVIHLHDESPDFIFAWAAMNPPGSDLGIIEATARIPKKGLMLIEEALQAYYSKKGDYVIVNEGKKFRQWFGFIQKESEVAFAKVEESVRIAKQDEKRSYWSFADFPGGSLLMVTIELPEVSSRNLLRRFANVFGLAYRRFADLKQAEAQAKEAKIEAALEKVRSKSLAMHRSEELQEVVTTVFDRLKELDIQTDAINLDVFNENKKDAYLWTAVPGHNYSKAIHIPFTDSVIFKDIYDGMISGKLLHSRVYPRELKDEFLNYIFQHTDFREIPQERKDLLYSTDASTVSVAYAKNTAIIAQRYRNNPFSDDENEILKRFAKVFDQAYTRFLDLQKAEAQAREAQIEAALERVRSQSMAMHKSEDLLKVITVVSEQLQHLNFKFNTVSFAINSQSHDYTFWFAILGDPTPIYIHVPYIESPMFDRMKDVLAEGIDFYADTLTPEENRKWHEHVFDHAVIPSMSEETKAYILRSAYARSIAIKPSIMLIVSNYAGKPYSESENEIIKRFGTVFEQSYTRFLDLQKAEAQARESQIQLAMERVRARTMAMQRSEELNEAASLLFQQVQSLGAPSWTAGYCIFDEDKRAVTLWVCGPWGDIQPSFRVPLDENPSFINYLEAYNKGLELYIEENSAKVNEQNYQYLLTIPVVSERLNSIIAQGLPLPIYQVDHCAYFSKGFLLFITYQQVPELHGVFKRFAAVFDQTYTRFLDLQKSEEQTRESQIQLALERVRARTMAMQRSEELSEAASLLFQQVQSLGALSWTAGYCIWDEDMKAITLWVSSPSGGIQAPFRVPLDENPTFIRYLEAYNKGLELYIEEMSGKALEEFYQYLHSLPVVGELLDSFIAEGQPLPTYEVDHCAYFSKGFLLFVTYQQVPELHDIFKRFAAVFDQTYTRFLDLQKAEAQAREAQIETALERVRARTMGMHNSSELIETAELLFDQLKQLGAETQGVAFAICEKDKVMVKKWTSIGVFSVPYTYEDGEQRMYDAWKRQTEIYEEVYEGERLRKYYELFMEIPEFKQGIQKFFDSGNPLPDWQKNHAIPFKYGYLLLITTKPFEETHIFTRFAKVFEQTYTRFLDLQKAEAQAREAQIETALERVRARTMGMQKSEDLRQVVKVLYSQLKELGFEQGGAAINIMDPDSGDIDSWGEGYDDGYDLPEKYHVPYSELPGLRELIMHWKSGAPYAVVEIAGQEKMSLDNYYFFHTDFIKVPETTKQFMMHQEAVVFSMAYMRYGALTWKPSPISDDQSKILQRFAKVFEQTYTRFLDLQKAESQAHEAQIEASLERIRSKAMGMHSSQDLAATIGTFYKELQTFCYTPLRCGVGLLSKKNKENELFTWNTTEEGQSLELVGKIRMEGHPILENIYEHWLTETEYHPVLRGKEISAYYQVLRPQMAFPDYPNDEVHYGYFFYFPEGGVYAWTQNEMQEDELKIYRRFTSVLSLTYKRYKDLKDAEARALLAVRESSLARVRAEIASMRTAEDLQRITPLIWHELTALGVPFFRCGIFIVNEKEQKAQVYLSNPQGNSLAVLNLEFDSSETNQNAIEHWRSQKVYIEHWDREQFAANTKSLIEQGQILTANSYQGGDEPPESLTLHFLPFSQGMLYVGSAGPLTDFHLDLAKALAEAFSVAYARYEDFSRLESAKKQVEKALVDLKQTQEQLVQQEKMASLGQLTAGIAHEIKNPLNFVNNFSEVSVELIDEVFEELEKLEASDCKEEIIALLEDVKSNIAKVNEHGKRADSIVKSMLQHSRSSGNKTASKEFNPIVREFANLAYHGMRAGKSPINVEIDLQLDPEVGEVKLISEDFSRVILNLCNNAFDAMREKLQEVSSSQSDYLPKLTICTKKTSDQEIQLIIGDNGKGIPEEIIDKILEPFFTTKKGTEGTGLGLSISYDIIKAHGGKLEVRSTVGVGTEFIIQIPTDF